MELAEKPASIDAAVVAHYRLVAHAMEQNFGRIPIVWTTPDPWKPPTPERHGSERCHDELVEAYWHAKHFGHWSHLSAEHVAFLASCGALELYSWTPLPDNPGRARFARFLLERPNADTQGAMLDVVRRAAVTMRDLLQANGFGAIPVLDAVGGVALFVPLADGPAYKPVLAWAHGIARAAIAANPELFSEAPNVHDDGRVHIHVATNAVARWSILPYSFRATVRRIATPVCWNELPACDMHAVPIESFANRFAAVGDVFAEQLRAIDPGPLPPAPHALTQEAASLPPRTHRGAWYGHGIVASTIRDILSDGIARTLPEIFKIAQERHLPLANTESQLLSDVELYLNREVAHGRKPAFIRTEDHKFRINEPPDPWPAPSPNAPEPSHNIDALIERLRTTSSDGSKAEDFEVAVCDAFNALGLLTTHVGGHGAPDGYADAPLGVKGYRVMLECKSGETLRKGPDFYEAAKYKDAYAAQYCMMIGGGTGTSQQEALAEMKNHGVSLWCAEDLIYALQSKLTPLELEAAFAPGIVAQDTIPDILWVRDHGQKKRVRFIADIIQQIGWTTQCAAAQANTPADAPLLTEDAAMLLVDQELAARGAHVNCTREEVRLAFQWLTNPLVGAAVELPEQAAIIIIASVEEK